LKSLSTIICLFLLAAVGSAQNPDDRFVRLAALLEEYAAEYPKIDKEIDIAMNGTLQEFAMAFSKETKVNLTVDPSVNQRVVVNFAETKPRDILLYLCRFYNLDLSFSGTILSLVPYRIAAPPRGPKPVDAKFNTYSEKLELNLNRDTLDYVLKKISELTQRNIIATKEVSFEVVSGYIGPTALTEALDQMAERNNLTVTLTDQNYFLVSRRAGDAPATAAKTKTGRPAAGQPGAAPVSSWASGANPGVAFSRDSLGDVLFNVHVQNAPIIDVLRQAAQATGRNLVLYNEPTNPVTVQVDSISFDELLEFLFNGTQFGYTIENGIYFIGDRKTEGVRQSTVVQLQHRTVRDIVRSIPKELGTDVQVEEFIELNSLILSGSPASIRQILDFVRQLDKAVPVVNIELTIVDVTSNADVRIGVEAGISNRVVQPGGTLYPGVDFTFSSNGVNQLLELLANNNIINLGQVKPNFYASLQAIEDNGYARINSKPRLSTINGREATFTIGETRYYEVQRTTLQGEQSPISLQDRTFQSVNADFTITILPVISGDENVTLEIKVLQSDFIGQVTSNAPPAQVTRSFNSNIRVKNGDMIVLGGLESKSTSGTGRGVPFLSRIPVIKWFFGKQRRMKNKTKLLLFIKPTVNY
jgi:type IV pilus assembly protein PilQ